MSSGALESVSNALTKLRDRAAAQDKGAVLLGVAGVLGVAAFLRRRWLVAEAATWRYQLRALALPEALQNGPVEWLSFQYETWQLLKLDVARRVEEAEVGKAFRAGVPHVNTAAATAKNKGKGAKMDTTPVLKDLVLIGGGHGHAFVLKNFGMKPLPGVRVTLITRDVLTPYSGMLPGHIAGVYTKEECHIDVLRLGKFAKATIIHAEATGIDLDSKRVFLSKGRPPVSFDVLSIDIGCTPKATNFFAASIPVTPVKPIDSFSARWDEILARISSTREPVTLGVVGGGAGGVEICLSMQERLRQELLKRNQDVKLLTVRLMSRSSTVMPSHSPRVQAKFMRILEEREVDVHVNANVIAVDGAELLCEDGKRVQADEVVWCTQAGTQSWLKDTGLELTPEGFIAVDEHMQSVNVRGVFACGDVAQMVEHPRPRAGVFAVRAGPPVAANLRHTLLGEDLEPYIPQDKFLGIIGTGRPELAIASKGPMALEGAWLWDLKDWIDRKWMGSYSHALPEMGSPEPEIPQVAHAAGAGALAALSHAAMRCGGCGAKVGATTLSRVLKRLELPPTEGRSDILIGLESPDDCAMVAAAPPGMATVHTVDFFRAFIDDPYTFGRIAANHSLSDCHAMCADASTALAIAVVPFSVEEKVEETLFQMMSGVCEALKESGCALGGGHTCEGAELAMGLVVNGVVDPAKCLRKDGLNPGDRIILTKAVGTGTIMAADMRVKAQGMWVARALESMAQSNRNAAFALRDIGGAKSCTDVTGFGVVGHLHEMAKASDVSITLKMDDLPILPGALECIELGIFSSLQPENLRLKRAVWNHSSAVKHPNFPLLFDPQTAGGLLAGVPEANVDACLGQLRELGYADAAVIGVVDALGGPRDPVKRIHCS